MSLLAKRLDYYKLYATTTEHKNKVRHSLRLIEKVCGRHERSYTAYSSGKDSLCLLHLTKTVNPEIRVMYFDSGVELPECAGIIEKTTREFNLNLSVLRSDKSILDIYEKKGAFYKAGKANFAFSATMLKAITEWAKQENLEVAFIGLRKEESVSRRIMLGKYGDYFYAKTNAIHECFPLAEWSGSDVFAYIFSNNLEPYLHPAYYKDALVDNPEKIRISWTCDPTAAVRGCFLWLRMYYPDIFNALSCRFKEINGYV